MAKRKESDAATPRNAKQPASTPLSAAKVPDGSVTKSKKRHQQAAELNGHADDAPKATLATPAASSAKFKRKRTQQEAGSAAAADIIARETAAVEPAVEKPATRDPLSPAVLKSHSAFFDHLVELVPARHYHGLDEGRVNTKFMKKADRAAAKAAFRKQHKKNKRDKLDPDKAQTALDVQRQLAAQAASERTAAAAPGAAAGAPADRSAAGGAAPPPQPGLRPNLTDSASREELQQRLAAKVAAHRQARNAEEQAKRTEAAKQFRASNGRQTGAKRKWEQNSAGKTPKRGRLSDADFQKKLAEVDQALSSGQTPPAKRPGAQPAGPDAANLSFGKLDVSLAPSQQRDKGKKKKRKDSKAGLLAKAEAAVKLKADAADSATQAKAVGEAWGAALARARGERVLDDPTRLRRSLKKDAKAAAKKAAAWSERVGTQKKEQADKQRKRTENLKTRSDAKLEKKKAKREKKLLRPGFEGRRSSFIDAPVAGGKRK